MPRRVLHLLSQRPSWTGSGVALEALVAAADRAGWEQSVVVGTPAEDPRPGVGGLPDERVLPLIFGEGGLPFPLPGMSDVMPYPSSRFAELTTDQLAAYRAAWRSHVSTAIEKFRPDVIHSHHYWLLSASVKDVAKSLPVLTHCHGTGFRQLVLCPHLADEVHAGCRRNERFLVLHAGHAQTLVEAGIPRERIEVIGSGFRPEIFHSAGRSSSVEPALAYAGKLSNAKGLPWLLDAVAQLTPDIPRLQLHVAGSGSGPEADAVRQRIAGMDNVVLHDYLDQSSLAALLRRSAVFVLPSFYEGLPLVLVEAAACGCRLVSTALPGVVEQLAEPLATAIELVPPPRMQDADRPVDADLPAFVDALARAIATALGKPPVAAADELVAGMTWEAVFRRCEALWQVLV